VTYGENFEVKPESPVLDDDDDADYRPSDDVASKTRSRGSLVWKFFVPRQTSAVCKLCQKSLKRPGGNTSNLFQHLHRAHREQHAAMMDEYRRRKMKTSKKFRYSAKLLDQRDDPSTEAYGDGENFEVKPGSPVLDKGEDYEELDELDSKDFEGVLHQMSGSHKVGGTAVWKKRGSLVWNFFSRQQKGAVCKLCRKSVKQSGGNTSNLFQHLKRAHGKQHASMMDEYRRRKMKASTRRTVC